MKESKRKILSIQNVKLKIIFCLFFEFNYFSSKGTKKSLNFCSHLQMKDTQWRDVNSLIKWLIIYKKYMKYNVFFLYLYHVHKHLFTALCCHLLSRYIVLLSFWLLNTLYYRCSFCWEWKQRQVVIIYWYRIRILLDFSFPV